MLRFAAGRQPSLDGVLAHADRAGDGARRHVFGAQPADRGIALGPGVSALAPSVVDPRMDTGTL